MKDYEIEKLLSSLKPAGLQDKTRKSITETIRLNEENASNDKYIFTPASFRAVILRAAAAIFVVIGSGIIIHRIITRPDDGAEARRAAISLTAKAETAKAEGENEPADLLQARLDMTPLSIRTHLLSESDEGIVMTPDGPVRMLRYQLIDNYEWPAAGRNLIKSVPREHIVLTGINSN